MDIMVSRQFFAFVTSSSCFIRDSKSEEGPDVVWVDGESFGCSCGWDLDIVRGALFKVIVIEGFYIWALFRTQLSWKAEHGGSTVKGIGREEGKGSLACRRNWASSSSSWRIVVHSLRQSRFSIFRSTKN